ncbi:MAG: galactose-1-phosphate uridylyltransferase [Thermoplasmata archaeon HGW-Thermoplasmata-1]|nr:MAG: galactose-1-phosphate uridylyltransferase [Thermoplasmata archaeon HGW-Thermoplasmata-1]
MHELRWHPLKREWVIVAAHRQGRPLMPKEFCPFCKGAAEIPGEFDVLSLENKFASLIKDAEEVARCDDASGGESTGCGERRDIKCGGECGDGYGGEKCGGGYKGDELYRKSRAVGACEVVIYTPEHGATLKDQPVEHIKRIVDLWDERYRELGAREEVKYVFPFENKGTLIGVTLPHPHGQIYAFPFVPPMVQRELDSAKEYYDAHGEKCIFCEILRKETDEAKNSRMVCENGHFFAFIPFFARLPYEVQVYSRRHVGSVSELDEDERFALAAMLKEIISRYDSFFGFELPYMMMLYQKPTDGDGHEYYHFHIEFRPLHRSPDKVKYLASVESGAGNFINDTVPEEKAKELRDVVLD